jgi:hypothetical protein
MRLTRTNATKLRISSLAIENGTGWYEYRKRRFSITTGIETANRFLDGRT